MGGSTVYAGYESMRNIKQHEGKGKGWACNNHNMRNPSLFLWGYERFFTLVHVRIHARQYVIARCKKYHACVCPSLTQNGRIEWK